jgi:multisubunit Na+/H+ antiporter MnhC subunit
MTNFIIKYQDPLSAIVIGLALAALALHYFDVLFY